MSTDIDALVDAIQHPPMNSLSRRVNLPQGLSALAVVVVCGLTLRQPSVAAPAGGKPAFTFRGAEYFHRWSQNTQHEFTPAKQEDLQAWTDMMTINAYPDVKDGDALAMLANAVLGSYTDAKAVVLNTRSVPRTTDQPAEHLIAVAFTRPAFIEVAFARLKLVDGVGYSAVYSHRIYGEKIGDSMRAWLRQNGPAAEKALLDWSSIREAAALARDLSRTKS